MEASANHRVERASSKGHAAHPDLGKYGHAYGSKSAPACCRKKDGCYSQKTRAFCEAARARWTDAAVGAAQARTGGFSHLGLLRRARRLVSSFLCFAPLAPFVDLFSGGSRRAMPQPPNTRARPRGAAAEGGWGINSARAKGETRLRLVENSKSNKRECCRNDETAGCANTHRGRRDQPTATAAAG